VIYSISTADLPAWCRYLAARQLVQTRKRR
jgi:hypothetical protein